LAGDRSRAQATVTLTRRIEVAWEHLLGIAERYPRRLTSMRKHLSWYFKATPHAAAVRRAVNSCLTLADYQRLLRSIEERPDDAG
jgi:tRNA-dihydrouridine synthase